MRASQDLGAPRAFVLGGNANTLAFVTSLRSEDKIVTVHLVPLAQTPLGIAAGDSWQKAGIALTTLLDWIDSTFAPDDERAFVAPVRDVELLARIEWHVDPPSRLDDASVLNIEDLPDEIVDALAHPPEPLVQCASCRRLCVRDHFVWKERQLCAWDYHKQVLGKRGPWHSGAYEERHFETIPQAAYVAPPLLEESGVDAVLAIAGIDAAIARDAINVVLTADATRPYLAVRTPDGFTLLREK
ncbi:MAG TPA: hypothetical protein VGZ02_03535 [Candidatus Baltobacteraceae bacterium]|jgi:hypothetical protein|nr:hypothetical protein [Candidatus Baltobacteraceae bacterium]